MKSIFPLLFGQVRKILMYRTCIDLPISILYSTSIELNIFYFNISNYSIIY